MDDFSERPIDDDDGIVSSLLLIGKTTRAIVGLRLIELGLFVGQDDLILRLDPFVPKNVGRVAEESNIRPSTVSKMIDRLIVADLVIRSRYPNDARITGILLTPAGVRMRQRILEMRRSLNEEIAHHIALAGLEVSPDLLRSVGKVVTARMKRLR